MLSFLSIFCLDHLFKDRIYIKSIKMNQGLSLLIVLLTITANFIYQYDGQKDQYAAWKQTFGCKQTIEEDSYRKIIFLRNLDIIAKHNADQSQTYRMGVNQFAALTELEFKSIYLQSSYKRPQGMLVNGDLQQSNQYKQQKITAEDIDWTEKGQVSPVKNQGSCGSCWAFSAVAVLESWALARGTSVDLSEQQLVDCSRLYGNMGCNGGFNTMGLAYVRDHGITDTQSYPYVAKNQECKIHGGSFKISKVHEVIGCNNLQNAIQKRPIGVGVDATKWSLYSSGIFNNCGKHIDHNVLLVGLTSTYYKIKNSWAASWGEKGFIRLALGNTCGICDDPSPWVQ